VRREGRDALENLGGSQKAWVRKESENRRHKIRNVCQSVLDGGGGENCGERVWTKGDVPLDEGGDQS